MCSAAWSFPSTTENSPSRPASPFRARNRRSTGVPARPAPWDRCCRSSPAFAVIARRMSSGGEGYFGLSWVLTSVFLGSWGLSLGRSESLAGLFQKLSVVFSITCWVIPNNFTPPSCPSVPRLLLFAPLRRHTYPEDLYVRFSKSVCGPVRYGVLSQDGGSRSCKKGLSVCGRQALTLSLYQGVKGCLGLLICKWFVFSEK